MLDKQFDHIINQKIREAKIDLPSSDWNVFSQKLKVAMESTGPQDQLFDEAIKTQLAAASLDIPTADWGAFAPKLQAGINSDISDADFDAAINQKIAEGNITSPAADWNTFADKLADAQFDASIKEKVDNSDIEMPNPEWPVLASLLATADILNNAEFDSAIQDKLVESSIDMPSSNWDALSAKMKDASISDQQMDAEVKTRLENYTTKYEESHWPILREKMIETRQLRNNLYGLKAFEAALTLLLFMTFANFFADGLIPEPMANAIEKNVAAEQVASNESTTSNEVVKPSTIAETAIDITSSQNTQIASVAITNANNNTQTERAVTNNTRRTNNTNTITDSGATSNNSLTSNNSASTTSNATSNSGLDTNNNTVVAENNIASTSLDQSSTALAAVENKQALNINPIGLIGLDAFANDRATLDPIFAFSPHVTVTKEEKKKSTNLYLSAGQINHTIFTPREQLYPTEDYTRATSNRVYDIRIGEQFNQIEIMTGVAWQEVVYRSEFKENIVIEEEEFQYSIDSLVYNFVKIPVNVRWNYPITERFGFFADLGVSANILTKTDYAINKLLLLEDPEPDFTPKPISVPVPGSTEQDDLDFSDTLHAMKDYQSGLSQGGSAKQNIIGNLDSGIGIKYQLTNGIDTYLRASMNQQLEQKTLGPNTDTFQTSWGIQFGLKLRVK